MQFRVVAYNKAGPSPASEPTKIHIVKHKNREYLFTPNLKYHIIFIVINSTLFSNKKVKPRIDRTNLKNVVVRAGKMVKYDVNVRGEPPPAITWFLVNREVSCYLETNIGQKACSVPFFY